MARSDQLADYRSKRELSRSGEPSGTRRSRHGDVFVIQRHDASTPHFDLRLRVGEVLVSWSVPKGPSLDPADKRLAVRTEDHPLDYVEFEGRIPADEYGGGMVVVWDTGTYRNLTERHGERIAMADAVENGHVRVWLDGHKLTGAFALTRTKIRGRDQWPLVKRDDEGADRRRKPTTTQPESVLSGRTNDDLAAE